MRLTYPCIEVASWEEARKISRILDDGDWIFRGQERANWSLKASLHREWQAAESKRPRPTLSIAKFERNCMHALRAVGSQYLPHLPDSNSPEWMAILQHHGCPTRLLDVTDSFYVAAYFALRNVRSDSDGAIWCFRREAFTTWVRERRLQDEASGGLAPDDLQAQLEDEDTFVGTEELLEIDEQLEDSGYIVAWRPDRLTPRMVAQQGLFLIPSDPETDISTLIGANLEQEGVIGWSRANVALSDFNPRSEDFEETPVVKVIIPNGERADAVIDLRSMNITEATLFPDLDGLCRSFAQQLLPRSTRESRLAKRRARTVRLLRRSGPD